jgi:hypothetical protein
MTSLEYYGKQASDAFDFFKTLKPENFNIIEGDRSNLDNFFQCASCASFQYAPDHFAPAQVVIYTVGRHVHDDPEKGKVSLDFSIFSKIKA